MRPSSARAVQNMANRARRYDTSAHVNAALTDVDGS